MVKPVDPASAVQLFIGGNLSGSFLEILEPFLPGLLLSFATCIAIYIVAPRATRFFRRILDEHPRLSESLKQEARHGRWVDRIFLVTAFAALLGFVVQDLHAYDAFRSFSDLRYYDGVLWGAVNGGDIFINPYRFNLILIALVPLYILFGGPRGLLVAQSLGLAVTVFPLYWYARRQIGRGMAYVLVLAYLVFPAVGLLNGATFYEIKLAIPLLAFATFFLLRRRYLPFFACLGLSLIVKQEVSFIALGFAAFLFLIQRQRLLGFSIAAIGIALALFIIEYFYPSVIGRTYPIFEERFSYLGTTLREVVSSILLRPGLALEHMFVPSKVSFLLSLFSPLALLPFLGLELTAIALPAFAYTLLSEMSYQVDPSISYWQSPLIPFLFFGAALGLKRLLGHATHLELTRRKLALTGLLLVSAELYLPSTWTQIVNPASIVLSRHDALGHRLIRQIPSGASVVTQMELFMPTLAEHRFDVHEFSLQCNYVRNAPDCGGPADYLFGDMTRPWYGYGTAVWEHWRASGYFEPVVEEDGYFLLRRKTTIDPTREFDNGWAILGYTPHPSTFTRPVNLRFGNTLTLLGYAPVPSRLVKGGETFRLIVEWQAGSEASDQYGLLVRLVDARGHIWAEDNRTSIAGLIPIAAWKAGDIYRDQYDLKLPLTIPPGDFRIQVGLWDSRAGRSVEAVNSDGHSLGADPVIGTIAVEKDTSNIPASYLPIERPLLVDMQEVRLIGTTEISQEINAGDVLQVGLYWRPREKPRGEYSITVQLRDASGKAVAEQTSLPAAGAYPTTKWQAGEILLDWHDVQVPANLAEGVYFLTILMHNAADRTLIGEASIAKVTVER